LVAETGGGPEEVVEEAEEHDDERYPDDTLMAGELPCSVLLCEPHAPK
jgi:hypothetical protein